MHTKDSHTARIEFRSLIDDAVAGNSTVITRFGKPVAVIRPFDSEWPITRKAVEAQMDTPAAASPDHRPAPEPLSVSASTGTTTTSGQNFISDPPTFTRPSSQAELDRQRGISLERQQTAQRARDQILRGSRKDK
jgi:antitoxin (DNA-binding transcriptional repressor) of toxin-antitoxin stability system